MWANQLKLLAERKLDTHMQMRIMGNKDMILSQRAADPTKTFSSATT
jgi:hypothetical protein